MNAKVNEQIQVCVKELQAHIQEQEELKKAAEIIPEAIPPFLSLDVGMKKIYVNCHIRDLSKARKFIREIVPGFRDKLNQVCHLYGDVGKAQYDSPNSIFSISAEFSIKNTPKGLIKPSCHWESYSHSGMYLACSSKEKADGQ